MPTHTKLVYDPQSPEENRFCLDRVQCDDGVEYAFVWRGTAKSEDGYQLPPAYFDWERLGRAVPEVVTQAEETGRSPVGLSASR